MHKDVQEVLVSHDQIRERCKVLGKQISDDYNKEHKVPLLVALLKGSIPFLSELMQNIKIDGLRFDVMDVSSYEGTESVGDVRIEKDLSTSIRDVSVLIVEDIIDSGKTLKEVKRMLMNKGASEVKVVTLLDKPEGRLVEDMEAEYVGFSIKNEFVVGYGLDYNQMYRNLPYVGVLKREVYE